MMELSRFPLDVQVCTMEIGSCEYVLLRGVAGPLMGEGKANRREGLAERSLSEAKWC